MSYFEELLLAMKDFEEGTPQEETPVEPSSADEEEETPLVLLPVPEAEAEEADAVPLVEVPQAVEEKAKNLGRGA